jgi:hypothetical protein
MAEPSTTDTPEEQAPAPFCDFLLKHAKGRTHDELSEALRDLILAVQDIGKPGKLVLTVAAKRVNDGQVEVAAQIKSTPPDIPQASIWFASADGELTRDDPTQMALYTEENRNR